MPRRAPALALPLLGALALPAVSGCSSTGAGAIVLSWRFVDGRDCFSAGAGTVEARPYADLARAPLVAFRCLDGLAPATVTADEVAGGGTLYLDARSSDGADLYHGELSLDAAPPGTGETRLVTLYAVAAQ